MGGETYTGDTNSPIAKMFPVAKTRIGIIMESY